MPILIAAKKPRMLELTARYADAWNLAWFGLPDERLAGVRGSWPPPALAGEIRPAWTDTVGVTVRYPSEPGADTSPGPSLVGTPEEIAAGLRAHAEAGADHLIASLDPCTEKTVAEFAEGRAVPGR
jgi:alkanesulfonate monooxygenase SsuD/methylene tetrahydromethanopterin reductase-like flavin-dependent oxidoreductase (luciferase family)